MKIASEVIWYAYIVRCSDGTLYAGSTNDISKRITTHNAGNGAKYTRSRLPIQLVFSQACVDKLTALKREREIKKLTRTEKLMLISQSDKLL